MIVKERELVLINAYGNSAWVGDLVVSTGVECTLLTNNRFKIKHQLVCSECHRGVREQDDHHCSEPD